jgi:alginate O-acetyltransferase complex protein AlgI
MQFNSYIFAVFFVVVLGVYSLPIGWRAQKVWLLVTSYLFYAAWDPVFIVLVWLSTFVDWTAARMILAAPNQRRKKLLLVLSVVVNIGVLAYFKYGNFVLENVVAGLHAVGIDYQPAPLDIVLPIGISFYTFHTLSYTLDIYLGRTKPWTSFLDFALYVTFFPALVAGPILRASQFLPQCTEQRRATARQLAWGLALLVLGLFQKCVLADIVMAPPVDDVFATGGHVGFVDGWMGTLAFAGQIVCDFAGYSTCAIGIALCFGFSLPDNFRFPYAAIGFSDFWQRWHISLSSWLRDYLYIPLGGNRRGPVRTYVNLVLTMLIGGLWHGASWTFVMWGGLHGAYLIGERVFEKLVGAAPWRTTLWARLLGAGVTFVLVCIAWVFFRATSFGQAFALLGSMFGLDGLRHGARVLEPSNYPLIALAMASILGIHWIMRDRRVEDVVERSPWFARSVALAIMIVAIILMQGQDRAFIYFQF